MAPGVIIMHEKAALVMDVLHAYEARLLLVDYVVYVSKRKLELV